MQLNNSASALPAAWVTPPAMHRDRTRVLGQDVAQTGTEGLRD
ncbi:MAG TPA: hypothetical protein VGK99_11025 [Acidobacteriota bacterium]